MGLGSGIRDPGYGIRKKPIPDPGSGSATLEVGTEEGGVDPGQIEGAQEPGLLQDFQSFLTLRK